MVQLYCFAICDDDRHFMDEFSQRLKEVFAAKDVEVHIETFCGTAPYLEQVKRGAAFDLTFLDILMDKENGYLFAKHLRSEEIQTDIIFVSSTESYAVKGYDVSPLFYLMKPVRDDQLARACEIFLKKHRPRRFLLELPGQICSIDFASLLYCEVLGHTLSLHLASGDTREVRQPLHEVEKLFPIGMFVRSHQSFLINLAHIASIARYELTLSTGQTLPISQSRYVDLQTKFIQYASRQGVRI